MSIWKVSLLSGVALLSALAFLAVSSPPERADAFIHEIIGAACRAGGEEVIPPGQVRAGQSFIRALQASGFIESIDTSVAGQVTINFDPDVPNSKFKSAGFDLTIPDGIAPGVDLILSPLVVLDPDFAAHANCKNLNP
jgi:hypothetical protein